MRRLLVSGAIVGVAVFILARDAGAQASIAGVVKDGTGAVLPGVTVEASSPDVRHQPRDQRVDAARRDRGRALRPLRHADVILVRDHASLLPAP